MKFSCAQKMPRFVLRHCGRLHSHSGDGNPPLPSPPTTSCVPLHHQQTIPIGPPSIPPLLILLFNPFWPSGDLLVESTPHSCTVHSSLPTLITHSGPFPCPFIPTHGSLPSTRRSSRLPQLTLLNLSNTSPSSLHTFYTVRRPRPSPLREMDPSPDNFIASNT